jgi:hypothetical protein
VIRRVKAAVLAIRGWRVKYFDLGLPRITSDDLGSIEDFRENPFIADFPTLQLADFRVDL